MRAFWKLGPNIENVRCLFVPSTDFFHFSGFDLIVENWGTIFSMKKAKIRYYWTELRRRASILLENSYPIQIYWENWKDFGFYGENMPFLGKKRKYALEMPVNVNRST